MAQKTRSILVSFSFLIFAAPLAFAAPLKVDGPASEVRFLAVGKPSLIKIRGQGAHPSGQLSAEGGTLKGEIALNLNELTTGISLRDRHMKEKYLESGKPGNESAVLEVTKAAPACLGPSPEHSCEFTGRLRLHGKTAEVKGTLVAKGGTGGPALHSEFPVKLSDFGIVVPAFAGVTVADEVQVSADLQLREAK